MERNPSSSSGTGLQEMLKPTAPSVTTATHLNPARLEVIGAKSVISVTEYEPCVWQPARDVVEFPPPPKDRDGDQFFECPYCFTICPRGSDKAWKAHIIHDLRPYVCTYENCKTSGQLYESRHDWIHHENTHHRKIWRCLEHSDQVFAELTTYKLHLETEHALQMDSPSMNRIIPASESTSTVTDRGCPVCSVVLDTPRALHSHIALHLERFSLFSLPRSIGVESEDQDEVSGTESDQAHGVIAGSREGDFNGDLDFDSEDDADKNLNRETPAHSRDLVETLVLDSEPGLGIQERITDLLPSVAEGQAKTQTSEPEPGQATNHVVPNVENSTDHSSEHTSTVVGTITHVIEDHNTPVYAVCFSPDDRLLSSVSDDKVVRIWNLETQLALTSLEGHRIGFRSLAWSLDGSKIASGSYDRTTKLWDVATWQCLRTVTGHQGAVSGLSFSADDQSLLSASHDKTCKLWDVDAGTERYGLSGHEAGVWSVGISPDARFAASGSSDRAVRIWNFASGALLRILKGHGRVVYALAFSPDSSILASGSNDWTIKIWDLHHSGRLLRTLEGHEKGVTALAFSPDGLLMASGSYDHTIRIWDRVEWQKTVGLLQGHTADVYAVAFSHDGTRLVSGSRDRIVKIWDIERKASV
ncbi:WD40-repeat-containing domain protein [Coniochaeta sp. 2T2.1]|nr:WD40-repeat-containing domain protein [Coniochaeta sp. 2T2.1]